MTVPTAADSQVSDPSAKPKKRKRGIIRRLFGFFGWCALLVILAVVIARPFLPRVVKWYVNRALDKSVLYSGKIGDVNLHLWRGAYSISDITSHQRLKDNNLDAVAPEVMLEELRSDNRELTRFLRSTHEACEKYNDVATASLIEVWIDQTERRAWFLSEIVGDFQ